MPSTLPILSRLPLNARDAIRAGMMYYAPLDASAGIRPILTPGDPAPIVETVDSDYSFRHGATRLLQDGLIDRARTAPQGVSSSRQHNNVLPESERFELWTFNGTPIVTPGQLDPRGEDQGRLITDDAATTESIEQTVVIANDSTHWTLGLWLRRDSDQTRFPEIRFRLADGNSRRITIHVNTQTGASAVVISVGTISHEVIRWNDDWWFLRITVQNNTSGNVTLSIGLYGANATVLGVQDPTAQGTSHFFGASAYNLEYWPGYIPTIGGPQISQADTITLPNPWAGHHSPAEGTIACIVTPRYDPAQVGADSIAFDCTALRLLLTDAGDYSTLWDDASVMATGFNYARNRSDVVVISWRNDVGADIDVNGVRRGGAAFDVGVPTTSGPMQLGHAAGASQLDGHVKHLAVWPYRMGIDERRAVFFALRDQVQ